MVNPLLNTFDSTLKRRFRGFAKGLPAVVAGLVLSIIACNLAMSEDSPIPNKEALQSNVRDQGLVKSQIKELSGRVLIDAQTEVTQPFQIDKYTNFVTISTPTLTPASGHAFLFSYRGVNQFVAKYSDGTTQVLGTGGSSSVPWGSITGTLSSQTDLQTALNALGSSTATLRTDFNTSTGTLQTNINLVGVATATLRSDFSSSTNTLQANINAVGVSTAALQTSINAVGVATGTIQANFPVSLSTNVTGSLPAASIAAGSLGALVKASSVAVNTVGVAQMNFTGTPSGTTYARGDGAWATVSAGASVYVQSVQCTVTASSATSVGSYVPTNLNCSITPGASANKIKITVTGAVGLAASASSGTSSFSIFRGSTRLSAFNGFTYYRHVDAVNGMRLPLAITYIDSPSTTSSTNYSLQFMNDSGVTVTFNDISGTAVMTLEEVSN